MKAISSDSDSDWLIESHLLLGKCSLAARFLLKLSTFAFLWPLADRDARKKGIGQRERIDVVIDTDVISKLFADFQSFVIFSFRDGVRIDLIDDRLQEKDNFGER